MPHTHRRFLNPETATQPTGYTHVVEAAGARTVYISGQVALDRAGKVVGAGDMQAQTEHIFRNLQAALAAVGGTFDDLVKVTYFVVDMTQMAVVREVRNRYLNAETPPASTAVEVSGLVIKELLIEIEAIAVLD